MYKEARLKVQRLFVDKIESKFKYLIIQKILTKIMLSITNQLIKQRMETFYILLIRYCLYLTFYHTKLFWFNKLKNREKFVIKGRCCMTAK